MLQDKARNLALERNESYHQLKREMERGHELEEQLKRERMHHEVWRKAAARREKEQQEQRQIEDALRQRLQILETRIANCTCYSHAPIAPSAI